MYWVVIWGLIRPCLPRCSIMFKINVYTTIATMITAIFCIDLLGLPRDSHHASSGCGAERGAIDSKPNKTRPYFEGQTRFRRSSKSLWLWLCVLCLIKLKMTLSYRNTQVRGSVVGFGGVLPEFESQQTPFCWNGYWARANFKHSEAKWR